MRHPASFGILLTAVALVGCSTTSGSTASGQGKPTAAAPASSSAGPATSSGPSHPTEATTVRFAAGNTTVDVVIDTDSPAVREFLGMLPLKIPFEEFNGREKIGYLPRKLDTSRTPGSDPEDGDLIYFVPWGNLGFYYNTAGTGHSDDVIHVGRYNATAEQLKGLENDEVTIAIVG
jgi:hypothetical protein